MSRPQTKEEEDIDILCSWVQVGGFPANPEEEAWGLLLEVSLLSSLSLLLLVWLSTSLYIPTPVFSFIFQGLDLLKRAGSMREEAHRLEMEAQCLETEGLEKMKVVVAGSEAKGFYGLLRGAMLHYSVSPAPPHHKKICHTPSATISHPPPRSPQDLMSVILKTRQ